jgi:hypothetical protein
LVILLGTFRGRIAFGGERRSDLVPGGAEYSTLEEASLVPKNPTLLIAFYQQFKNKQEEAQRERCENICGF